MAGDQLYLLGDQGLAGHPRPRSQVRFVALTGSAMAACEERKLEYRRIDSWCDPAQIAELGWANYRNFDALCEQVDQTLWRLVPDLAERAIQPLRFSFYEAKMVVDSLSTKVLMLNRMAKANPGVQWVLHRPTLSPPARRLPGFDARTDLFGHIVADGLLGRDVSLHWLDAAPPMFERGADGQGWAAGIRARLRAAAKRLRPPRRGQFLLFAPGHDISYVLPRLAARGLRPMAPAEGKRRSAIDHAACLAELRRLPALAAVSQVEGCDMLPLLVEYLIKPLLYQIPVAVAAYDAVAAQLERHPARFALTASVNLGLAARAQMEAARRTGAPLVTYQEGAGYGSMETPIYDYTEMRDGDLFLAYGDGNAEHYQEREWPVKPMYTVGSAHQEALRRNLRQAHRQPRKRRTVIYVGTCSATNINHVPNNGLVETYYLEQQRHIFESMLTLPEDFDLAARLHPSDQGGAALLRLPQFARLRRELRPMEQLLDQADVFIIDFPSTVLLSACFTEARLLVLAQHGVTGLSRSQESRLSSRAEVVHSPEELGAAIRALPDQWGLGVRSGDDYLTAYCLPRLAGSAADRAAEILSTLGTPSSLGVTGTGCIHDP